MVIFFQSWLDLLDQRIELWLLDQSGVQISYSLIFFINKNATTFKTQLSIERGLELELLLERERERGVRIVNLCGVDREKVHPMQTNALLTTLRSACIIFIPKV